MSAVRQFRVGTFYSPELCGRRYAAYTTWYSPTWKGCIEYKVAAKNGTEAKKKAIALRKAHESSKSIALPKALTIKADGKREVEIDSARESGEVMLSISAVASYERDLYAFLTREAAEQLRDWLNGFLSSSDQGANQ